MILGRIPRVFKSFLVALFVVSLFSFFFSDRISFDPEPSCSDLFAITRWAAQQRGNESAEIESLKFSKKLFLSFKNWYRSHDEKILAAQRSRLQKLLLSEGQKWIREQKCNVFRSLLPKSMTGQQAQIELAKIFLGAVDKYSTYFTNEEFEEFYNGLSGSHSGFGLTVAKDMSGLKVEKVYENSPAERAGLKPGDLILAVNSQKLELLNFEASTQLLKQEKVDLTVASHHRVFNTKLKKESGVFKDQTISFRMIPTESENSFAWVTIPQFYGKGGFASNGGQEQSSSQDFYQILMGLEKNYPQHSGMVIDLRGNPGGYLEEAVNIAGYFLGPKTIVKVRSKNESKNLSCESCSQPIYEKPIILWVDQETASSAEVLTAALKDYKRAWVIGSQRTFGKGTVQKLMALDDPYLALNLSDNNGFLKITTSQFYSPNNKSPEGVGVFSDFEVKTKNVQAGEKCVAAILTEIESLGFSPGALPHKVRNRPDGSVPEECLQD